MIVILGACALARLAFAQGGADPVPFPHPSITEVLFHVPNDAAADPSRDGKRSAVGDEFIEIANLHDEPINIGGYTLSDRGDQVRFIFPDLTLAPGEIAIVFNGHDTTIPGPVGSATAAPAARNDQFHGAWVFNLHNDKASIALANQSDRVMLCSPDGHPRDIVMWGISDMRGYTSNPRIGFTKPSPGCSVQRVAGTEELLLHTEIDGELFSPGRIPEKPNTEEN